MRRANPRRRCWSALTAAAGLAFAAVVGAAELEPDHFRGTVVDVRPAKLTLKTRDGSLVQLAVPASAKVYALSKASFEEIGLGTYVGSVAIKPDPATHKPVRSLSLLHVAVELRILDEGLRGVALGERKWDLRPDTVVAHGWIDDIEARVLSIKYGPTDHDETDVDVPANAPITRMSVGSPRQVKRGVPVFVGARKRADGGHAVEYLVVGKDGIAPGM